MLTTDKRLLRLGFPLVERTFTQSRYAAMVERLADERRYTVVPLREFHSAPRGPRAVVGLRHDVDFRLDNALELASIEHRHGLHATYFVLHTAKYWRDPQLITKLRKLQDDLGHEIGWHNDLVTLHCVLRVDAVAFLGRELARLRSAGIEITGVAAHGSPYCHDFGYHNAYFFTDLDTLVPGFPNRTSVRIHGSVCEIPKVSLAEFGFEYDAYRLDNELYFSDASFGENGRRWHTDSLNFDALGQRTKTIILTHPCHWDASFRRKLSRWGSLARGRLAHC